MKTESEIRKHKDDLLRQGLVPCRHSHDDPIAAAECEQGRVYILVAAKTLLWVLGEDPNYDRMVEEFAAEARR